MANKEDHPTYAEALYGPDSFGFISAMKTKILTLIELNVFDMVERKPDMNVISGVWVLRCKRYSDGLIRKLKARYCARGFEKIEGLDYFKTHSPVVMWMSVCLLLVMSILLNLETSQINYTTAFVHAPIDCLVYVEAPVGFCTQIGDVDCVREDSTIHLTQKGLAYRIVEAMHLNDKTVDPVDAPCTKYLPIDEFGCPAHGEFSYPSIVGQLNYLQGHSRSDITMATSNVTFTIQKISQTSTYLYWSIL
mmetsp:Transcript_49248/g.50020  ORF Transcript_49248/g.50020 Transcript_49248/m.50020 type:complete len:249 (+) Transcript_49248:216-962(+)